MPSLARAVVAGLVVALLTPLGGGSASAATAESAPISAPETTHDHGDDVLIPTPGRHDGVGAHEVGAHARGAYVPRKWPTNRITYYESIPAKWQWSLDDALKRWHLTGAKVRFVKVSSPSKARLIIRYGPTYGADGIGTLGYNPYGKNIVHLSTKYKRVDHFDPAQRAWVSRLFAHELGHNLGYEHVRARCALMVAIFMFGECGPLSATPGYYECGYIDDKLLARHVKWYGGRRKKQVKDCLLAPLPEQVTELTASGGTEAHNGLVTLRWNVPRPPTAGKVVVREWKADSCAAEPPSALESAELGPAVTSWTTPEGTDGNSCYAVSVVNRYDGARSPIIIGPILRQRARPAAPVVSGLRWDADSHLWRFTVPGLTGAQGVRMATDGTATCPGPASRESYVWADGDQYYYAPEATRECIALWVHDYETNLSSDRVLVRLEAPESVFSATSVT